MNEQITEISLEADEAAEQFRQWSMMKRWYLWYSNSEPHNELKKVIQLAIDKSTAPLKEEIEQLRSIAMGVNMDELHRLQQHVKVLREVLRDVLRDVDERVRGWNGRISNTVWIRCKKALELTNPNP